MIASMSALHPISLPIAPSLKAYLWPVDADIRFNRMIDRPTGSWVVVVCGWSRS